MKIYLAGAWGTNEYMGKVRNSLRRIGHEVTSRWIDVQEVKPGSSGAPHAGITDIEDIERADALACFTVNPSTTGGFFHEFGYAMGLRKKLFVIGEPLNIFMSHPRVMIFRNDTEFLTAMNSSLFMSPTSVVSMNEWASAWELAVGLYGFLNQQDWRIIAAITEEAGEAQGAFNKYKDGLVGKLHERPKDMGDVKEEMAQTMGCILVAAYHFGMTEQEFWDLVRGFLDRKRRQLAGGF